MSSQADSEEPGEEREHALARELHLNQEAVVGTRGKRDSSTGWKEILGYKDMGNTHSFSEKKSLPSTNT